MAGALSGRFVSMVALDSYEECALPAPVHIVYVIVVKLPVQSWKVQRRFSEFVALEAQLRTQAPPAGAGRAPPARLPPKHAVQHTFSLLSRSNTVAAQRQTAEQRLPELRAWLKEIVDNSDSVWRDSTVFREFLELPQDVHFSDPTARLTQSAARLSSAKSSGQGRGAYTQAASSSTGGVRRLGAAQPAAARETDQTRALDDGELLASQNAQMDAQDEQLGRLAGILRRQREMGLAINQELAEQSELLQQLDSEVVTVQDKMHQGEAKMRKLGG